MNFRPTNIEKGEGGKSSLFKLIGPIIMSLIVARRGDYKLIFTERRGEYELVITEPQATIIVLV